MSSPCFPLLRISLFSAICCLSFSCTFLLPEKSQNRVAAAIISGEMEILAGYLEEGGDPDVICSDGVTLLGLAAARGNESAVSLLLGKRADPNIPDRNSGFTPLMSAAAENYAGIARFLIEAGADLNHVAKNGHSALSLAVRYGNYETVEVLLTGGAIADFTNPLTGNSPLRDAYMLGHKNIARLLEKHLQEMNGDGK